TFANRQDRTLTVEAYRATGGIAQAVATTADAIYDALDEADQKLLRRLMLALVAVTDGAKDTRRRVPRDQLHDLLHAHPPPDPHPHPARRAPGRRILPQPPTDGGAPPEDAPSIPSPKPPTRACPRPQHWLPEARDGLRLHREPPARAPAGPRHHRDPASLYA